MLESIRMEGYRGFGDFSVNGLSRVNLIVGKNNCGKTSLLEAITFFLSRGNPLVLKGIAGERGEVLVVREEDGRSQQLADISHFFLGHTLSPGATFRISSGSESNQISVKLFSTHEAEGQTELFDKIERANSDFIVGFEDSQKELDNTENFALVTENGAFQYPRHHPRMRMVHGSRNQAAPLQFVRSVPMEPAAINLLWDKVIVDGREGEIIESMRIICPELTGIFFLSSTRSPAWHDFTEVVVSVEGQSRRIPLGSFGDGMRRLLTLSLSLNQAQNGTFLIDEIDTGIHYGAMEDLWRFVVEAADQFNTQVFATTHSLDCLRGLASLCENHPGLTKHVSVQKIDPELSEAVALNAEQIVVAANQAIEMR